MPDHDKTIHCQGKRRKRHPASNVAASLNWEGFDWFYTRVTSTELNQAAVAVLRSAKQSGIWNRTCSGVSRALLPYSFVLRGSEKKEADVCTS